MKKKTKKYMIIIGILLLLGVSGTTIWEINKKEKYQKDKTSIVEEKDVDVGENNTSETVSEKKDNTTEKTDKTDTKKDTSTEKTDTGNKKDNKTTETVSNKTDKTTEKNDGQTNNSNNSNNSSTVASASNNASNDNSTANNGTANNNNTAPSASGNNANNNTTTESPKPTTTEAPKPTTTESPKPSTTEANKPSTTEATTEKAKVWHEPVYEKVWVVDFDAWDEPIVEYHAVCNTCGADLTGTTWRNHCEAGAIDGVNVCHSYSTGVPVIVGYTHHEATGHYEQKLIKDGYWE